MVLCIFFRNLLDKVYKIYNLDEIMGRKVGVVGSKKDKDMWVNKIMYDNYVFC